MSAGHVPNYSKWEPYSEVKHLVDGWYTLSLGGEAVSDPFLAWCDLHVECRWATWMNYVIFERQDAALHVSLTWNLEFVR